MSAASRSPTHLLERLNTLQAYVKGLAVRCGQEDAFAAQIASAAKTATRARNSRSRRLVESAILEHRELARSLYNAARPQAHLDPEDSPASRAPVL